MNYKAISQTLVAFGLVLSLAVSFSVAYAQDQSDGDRLRAEIKTAIMSDPRSGSLSEGELNAMIEVLAGETEKQGATYDFILPPPPFIDPATFPIETPWGLMISPAMLYLIILVCLALAGLILWWALRRHHVPLVPPAGVV